MRLLGGLIVGLYVGLFIYMRYSDRAFKKISRQHDALDARIRNLERR